MSGMLRAKRYKKDTPLGVRYAIAGRLLQASKDGRIPRGTVPAIAHEYGLSKSTIYRIHKKAVKSLEAGSFDLSPKRKPKNKHKVKHKPLALLEALEEIPFSDRTTVRDSARSLGIPPSTFRYHVVQHKIATRHSNCLKPILTDENKAARLEYAKSFVLDINTGEIDPCYDVVHVDEKVFTITRKNQNFYLTPFEDPPVRQVKNSQHPIQVMFVVAFARPRYCPLTGVWFSGKIGCWPFVVQVAAKRNSKNRPKGTLETKPMTVTKAVYREFLLKKIIPAIRKKWPLSFFKKDPHLDRSTPIYIQQDNCRVHVSPTEPAVVAAGKKRGWNIRMKNQPANSPDFNVCDLGLFRAMDSIQFKTPKSTIDSLITSVIDAFQQLEIEKINNCFLTLQHCVSEVIVKEGGNTYKVPHMNKTKLLHEGVLPDNVKLTYLARMRMRPGETAFEQVQLFGVDDDDLDSSDDDAVVVLEPANGPGVARLPPPNDHAEMQNAGKEKRTTTTE